MSSHIMKTYQFEDEEAIDLVRKGSLLLLPTETVYGIGVRWDSQQGYEELVRAKKRRPDKPIAVMVWKDFDLDAYFEISPRAKRVMDRFLPGPLTVLVKAKSNVPYQATLGTGVCGIRIPGSEELLKFLEKGNVPLQVTSANLSGEIATSDYEKAREVFLDDPRVKGIIKGSCRSKVPTTVVDLTKENPVIIREGEITRQEIEEAFYGKEAA